MMKKGFRNNPPVNVGDELDVTIESVGEKGDGVAKKDGFVLFVPGAQKGQRVRIKVNRVLKSVGFAEIVGQAAQSSEQEEPRTEEAQSEESYEEEPQDSEDFGEEDP